MPLTPEDVANKQFTSTRLKPGYDETEVDEFLDEVEAELVRLTSENGDLRGRLTAAGHSDDLPSVPVTDSAASSPAETPADTTTDDTPVETTGASEPVVTATSTTPGRRSR